MRAREVLQTFQSLRSGPPRPRAMEQSPDSGPRMVLSFRPVSEPARARQHTDAIHTVTQCTLAAQACPGLPVSPLLGSSQRHSFPARVPSQDGSEGCFFQ